LWSPGLLTYGRRRRTCAPDADATAGDQDHDDPEELARCLAAIALLLAGLTSAHAWPEKPITVIVPTSAGSSLDQNVRRVMEEVARTLKQAVIIDNRPGGGGALALAGLAHAAPDGYTIGVGNTASLVITPEINSKAKSRYNPLTDFEFIARFTSQANLLVVKPTLPVNTVAELTQYLRAHPGKLFLGSQGNGSTGHLSGEMYKRAANVNFVHVPYRSGPQAVQDMLGGNIDFMFENISTIESHVDAGKVRVLAVTSNKRTPRFPNVPTMQEAGVAGYEVVSWSGIVAPARTPPEIVERLNKAINAALGLHDIKDFVTRRGGVIHGGSSAEFKSLVGAEVVTWGNLIKSIGGLSEDR
jgi:tripartite-type tricarboxylate transporter receptor subunit TctC